MSMDEAGSGQPLEASTTKQKGTRSRPAKVRKHAVENVNKNNLAQYLDKLHAEGGVLVDLNISLAIGGSYEVVSFKETNA
jgi:hypothetical protein